MNRLKLLISLLGLWSISALADYHCTLKVSHLEEPQKIVAMKLISIDESIRSGSEGMILDTFEVDAFLNGKSFEEEAELVFIDKMNVSEKIVLKGNATSVDLFNTFKIQTSCRSQETPANSHS